MRPHHVENEGGGIAHDVNFVVISGPLIYAGGLPPTAAHGGASSPLSVRTRRGLWLRPHDE